MKEFALKHPWLTFILVDITAYNIFTVVNNAIKLAAVNKEAKANESSSDIQ